MPGRRFVYERECGQLRPDGSEAARQGRMKRSDEIGRSGRIIVRQNYAGETVW